MKSIGWFILLMLAAGILFFGVRRGTREAVREEVAETQSEQIAPPPAAPESGAVVEPTLENITIWNPEDLPPVTAMDEGLLEDETRVVLQSVDGAFDP
ncbi:MAG: hypothetical protein LBN38_02860 [Verrucomicrobiota bacterium]|jgi:hypothetical protein|nr:hypothetical protein [Verrucomicrobiota bacterium]